MAPVEFAGHDGGVACAPPVVDIERQMRIGQDGIEGQIGRSGSAPEGGLVQRVSQGLEQTRRKRPESDLARGASFSHTCGIVAQTDFYATFMAISEDADAMYF